MKLTNKKLPILIALLLLSMSTASAYSQSNLLPNSSFENGTYIYFAQSNLNPPVEWQFWHALPTDEKVTGQTLDWAQPLSVGVDSSFTQSGSNSFKAAARPFQPMWTVLYTDVSGLNSGGDYEFVAPILFRPVTQVSPEILGQDYMGMFRLKVEIPGGNIIADTGWFRQNPNVWTQNKLTFKAPQSSVRVAIEARGEVPIDSLEWYFDDVSLTLKSAPPTNTPSAPSATNTPVPAPTSSVPTAMPPAALTQQASYIQATIQAGQAAYNATLTAQAPPPTAAQPQAQAAAPTENAYQQLLNRTAPTDFPIPAADSDGKIRYIVQPNDSLVHIATVACGETLDCLERLKAMNNLTSNVIWVGQELIIGPFEGQQAAAAPEPTATPEPAAESADAAAADTAAEGEDAAAEPAAEEVDTAATEQAVAQAEADAQATAEAIALAEAEQAAIDPAEAADGAEEAAPEGTGSICVVMYDDENANGTFDAAELAVLNGLFSLVNVTSNNVLSEHTTTGSTEPYCFEGLASDSYRVVSVPPSGYSATTRQEWDLTLASGSTADLQFGAQLVDENAVDAAADDAGGERNIVTALLGAFGVIFLLLAAGVAGFLILANRRNTAEEEE